MYMCQVNINVIDLHLMNNTILALITLLMLATITTNMSLMTSTTQLMFISNNCH